MLLFLYLKYHKFDQGHYDEDACQERRLVHSLTPDTLQFVM
jgi:hypothetical protein